MVRVLGHGLGWCMQHLHPSSPHLHPSSLTSTPHPLTSPPPLIPHPHLHPSPSSLISTPRPHLHSSPSSLTSTPHPHPSPPPLIPHLHPSSLTSTPRPHLHPSPSSLTSTPHPSPPPLALTSTPHPHPSPPPLIPSPPPLIPHLHPSPSPPPLTLIPHLHPSSFTSTPRPHLHPSPSSLTSTPHPSPPPLALTSTPHPHPSPPPLIPHLHPCPHPHLHPCNFIAVEHGSHLKPSPTVHISERRGSMPAGTKYSSPLLTRNTSNDFNSLAVGKGRTRDPSIKTPSSVLLIPALEFKAHYHSVVGKRPPRVPMPTPAPSHSPPSKEQSIPPTHPDAAMLKGSSLPSVGVASHGNLPAKKGMLSLSATISSLPSDVELTPSILEFIEQIAKPTIAATNFNSSSNESELEEEEEEEEVTLAAHHPATTETNPISFPVDVIIMFNIQPSTVQLSCKPQSRVQCLIQSPNVHVMVSFSLFSQEQLEVTTTSDSISSHLAELTSKTITFNNFHVTACLTTFALQLYSPQAQSLREGEESKSDNKEALSLTLGHALIHLSRKSVLAPSLRRPFNKITSVDDYTMCHKMQVSST